MKLEANTILQASPHVRSIATADGAALLDIHAGVCYSLNPVGATIWEHIQSNSTGIGIDAILLHLEHTCNISRKEVQDDILAYLRNLKDRSLVICSSNGSGPPK
jgi:hypothetical protein